MGNYNSDSEQKSFRVLHLYTDLINGDTINKRKEADRFGKTNRTIQSDIDTIRNFLIDRASDGEPERSSAIGQIRLLNMKD